MVPFELVRLGELRRLSVWVGVLEKGERGKMEIVDS